MKGKSVFLTGLLLTAILAGCGAPASTQTPVPSETPVQGMPSTGKLDFLLVGKDGNDNYYDKKNASKVENSPLEGKTIYWLGSSVTYGSGSSGQSVAHYLAQTDGAVCVVDAVSGTTLATYSESDETSYLARLLKGEKLKPEERIDFFVCQISTNDCKDENVGQLGELTGDDVTDLDSFDTATTAGSLEYVIRYVHDTWNCPIYFYSCAYFGDEGLRGNQSPSGTNYEKLVDMTHQAAEKWNRLGEYQVKVIDLYHDTEFNALVSDTDYEFLMRDAIHPRKAGYMVWWLPEFQKAFYSECQS